MVSCQALPVALYRNNNPKNKAVMPFVYTNPKLCSTLSEGDRALVFGSSESIKRALASLSLPLSANILDPSTLPGAAPRPHGVPVATADTPVVSLLSSENCKVHPFE